MEDEEDDTHVDDEPQISLSDPSHDNSTEQALVAREGWNELIWSFGVSGLMTVSLNHLLSDDVN